MATKKEKEWSILYRTILGTAICLGLAGIILFWIPALRKMQKLNARQEQLQNENTQIIEKIHATQENQEQFQNNPEVVVRTARSVGYAKPDDIVFKFTDDSTQTPAE